MDFSASRKQTIWDTIQETELNIAEFEEMFGKAIKAPVTEDKEKEKQANVKVIQFVLYLIKYIESYIGFGWQKIKCHCGKNCNKNSM
jgi:hypothetical protein